MTTRERKTVVGQAVQRNLSRATSRDRRGAAFVLGASATLLATSLSAQTIENVVVTAARRESTLQDIPYNISAVSSEALQQSRTTSLSDLSQIVAGISFADAGPTSRSDIVLRGINSNATDTPSSNAVAPVSMYIGETPMFVSLQISDVERVEVLRGPQGTLYGSGSLAGTLRFIPRKPDPSAFHAEVDADVGMLDASDELDKSAFGVLNVPLSETAALRVSAGYEHYAGFIDENSIVRLDPPGSAINSPVGIPTSADGTLLGPLAFDPIEDANDADVWHARASFLFEPNERFSVLLAYQHQDSQSDGAQAHSPDFSGSVDTPPADNIYWSPDYPVSFPTGGVVFPANGDHDANNTFLLSSERKTDLISADLSYDFGFASLSSSTSYYEDQGSSVGDNTGLLSLYPDFYGFIPRMVDYQTGENQDEGFVQELRLVSDTGGKFDYVVGLFYQNLKTDSTGMQWIPGQTFFGGLTGFAGANADTLGDVNVIGFTRTDFKDRAVFGELTWHVTDDWQVTGGVRKFKQDFEIADATAFPFCGAPCDNGGGTLGNTFVQSSSDVSDQIFKLNTSYTVNSDLKVYANYAEGFRRGGSTGIPISGPFAGNPELLTYDPDQTKNYEVGAKGSFGANIFSVALFYIDWTNFQVEDSSAASGSAVVVNGASARSQGIEVELNGALTDRLQYRFGYAYADAEVSEDFSVIDLENSLAGPVPVAIVEASKGDPLPNAPKHSITLALDYTHPAPAVLPSWDMRWHLHGNYRSSTLSQLVSANPADPPPFELEGFSMFGASVNLEDTKGLSLGLYVDNIFNELGVTGGSDRGNVGLRAEQFYVARPRTIGLRAGYRF